MRGLLLDGLIEVGKEGEELAFLSWRDPDPLPLRVFSFSTWTGIEAKFFYDCPNEVSLNATVSVFTFWLAKATVSFCRTVFEKV